MTRETTHVVTHLIFQYNRAISQQEEAHNSPIHLQIQSPLTYLLNWMAQINWSFTLAKITTCSLSLSPSAQNVIPAAARAATFNWSAIEKRNRHSVSRKRFISHRRHHWLVKVSYHSLNRCTRSLVDLSHTCFKYVTHCTFLLFMNKLFILMWSFVFLSSQV